MKKITRFYKKIALNLKPKINVDKITKNFQSLMKYLIILVQTKDKCKKFYDKNSNLVIGHGFAKFYESIYQILEVKTLIILEIGTWLGASSSCIYNLLSQSKYLRCR